MNRLFEAYRAFHNQGFIPIFVDDNLDSRMLVEACLEAGFKGIEYTLRRRDAHKMIPWIRKNNPDLYLLAGSTLDHDLIVHRARKSGHEQLLTLDELAQFDVDGFVSMHGFTKKTIEKYKQTHLLIPTAMTINEALQQFVTGAHFIKMLGPKLELVRLCRSKPTFNYCPVLITGGMTLEKIPEAVQTGGVLIGSGFDLMLSNQDLSSLEQNKIVPILKRYRETTQKAIDTVYPKLACVRGASKSDWLAALPHQHPFGDDDSLNNNYMKL